MNTHEILHGNQFGFYSNHSAHMAIFQLLGKINDSVMQSEKKKTIRIYRKHLIQLVNYISQLFLILYLLMHDTTILYWYENLISMLNESSK